MKTMQHLFTTPQKDSTDTAKLLLEPGAKMEARNVNNGIPLHSGTTP